jgi:hypothetical protein
LALRGTISIGVWHSVAASHRLQADAFLRGEPALSYDPSDFGHDLYWSRGGVNHGI